MKYSSYIFCLLTAQLLFAVAVWSQSPTLQRLELKRLALENKYRSVGAFDSATGIATVYDDMKMGYIDTTGKIIFPLGGYVTHPFYNGLGICVRKDAVVGINKYGQVQKEFPTLLNHSWFEKDVARINEKATGPHLYGMMDGNGNKLIDCRYEYISRLSENYFYVNNNRTGSGIINRAGDTIVPLKYNIEYFDTSTLTFIGYRQDTSFGIFNAKGEILKFLARNVYTNTSVIEGVHYFQRDGRIIVKDRFSDDSAKYAVLNLQLDTVVPAGKFFYLSDINEGLIRFSTSVTTDRYGRRTNPYQYIRSGFLDLQESVVIPANFDFAHYFTEGLSAVRVNTKWGFINKKGKIVIPLQFDYALPFKNGYAKVKRNDRFYMIDRAGNVVLNAKPY